MLAICLRHGPSQSPPDPLIESADRVTAQPGQGNTVHNDYILIDCIPFIICDPVAHVRIWSIITQ
jgi:hypothetical protein